MAVTRLIPLHINKGKTIAQCLTDRLEYGKNGRKTEDGKYISSYECDPRTADEEFLLAKRQYLHITGRKQEKDVIAYQIRQSFKPGEISPRKRMRSAMNWQCVLQRASCFYRSNSYGPGAYPQSYLFQFYLSGL